MPTAHSVFKQTVLYVIVHQLQQHTIEICCKMLHLHTCAANHSYHQQKSFISAWCWPW